MKKIQIEKTGEEPDNIAEIFEHIDSIIDGEVSLTSTLIQPYDWDSLIRFYVKELVYRGVSLKRFHIKT